MRDKVEDMLYNVNEESQALFADGFDDAIVGVHLDWERVIYDKAKMIEILVNEGMTDLDAIEYLEFNVWDAYVGTHTPIYIDAVSYEA